MTDSLFLSDLNRALDEAGLRLGVTGSLKPEIYHALEKDKPLLQDIVQEILEAHFPSSMHEDILDAVGLQRQYEYCLVSGSAGEHEGQERLWNAEAESGRGVRKHIQAFLKLS